jgi:hypothetical protein
MMTSKWRDRTRKLTTLREIGCHVGPFTDGKNVLLDLFNDPLFVVILIKTGYIGEFGRDASIRVVLF